MSYYLNTDEALALYRDEAENPYFVDKSDMIGLLLPLAKTGRKNICISRPRRFGKSVTAAMIAAFFTRGLESRPVFDSLKIAANPLYAASINQYDVFYINFLKTANLSGSFDEFLDLVTEMIREDLREAFPEVHYRTRGNVIWDLSAVRNQTGTRFIFVMDEWDCIFHKEYTGEQDRRKYINFLAALTKDSAYIALTYMTGVLPVAKYSSGSSLNHFEESNLSSSDEYSEFFGFTEEEVEELLERYRKNVPEPSLTKRDLKTWYDGYQTRKGHLYNPRSIVTALTKNKLGSYWTATGEFSEITSYIQSDVDGVKAAVARMVAGESIPIRMQEYAVSAGRLDTRDRILSAMVVYGFLTYDEKDQTVRIPNRELRIEFAETIREESSLGYINRLARASDVILKATKAGDADTVARILEAVHEDTPIQAYNSEAELASVVYFAYLSALDTYEIRREEQVGRGVADFILMPRDRRGDGIILELKKDHTPEEAIRQIREKRYADVFRGRLGERSWSGKRILAVGITYDSKSGKHRCKIEEWPSDSVPETPEERK